MSARERARPWFRRSLSMEEVYELAEALEQNQRQDRKWLENHAALETIPERYWSLAIAWWGIVPLEFWRALA